jgi:hypothetical protein
MPRFRWLGTVALAVLPVLPMSTSPGHVAQGHHGTGQPARLVRQSWNPALSRHFGVPGNASGFSTILAADGVVWVFGGTNPGGPSFPVAERLLGGRWTALRLPARLTNFISDASAPSRHDIWAASSYGRYVLHWDGTRWQLARQWHSPGTLSDVVATGPRDAWVFGTSSGGRRSLGTWHYDGSSWQPVQGLARTIYRASALSDRDIWAITAGHRGDAIIRFNGRSWHRVRSGPALAGIRWHDILAESARDVWLAGNATGKKYQGHLVLAHWNGTRWSRRVTPLSALAGQLAAAGSGGVLATASSSALVPTGLIVMMSLDGRLASSVISSSFGCGASDVTLAGNARSIWATGGSLTRSGSDAVVWVRPLPGSLEPRDIH